MVVTIFSFNMQSFKYVMQDEKIWLTLLYCMIIDEY